MMGSVFFLDTYYGGRPTVSYLRIDEAHNSGIRYTPHVAYEEYLLQGITAEILGVHWGVTMDEHKELLRRYRDLEDAQ